MHESSPAKNSSPVQSGRFPLPALLAVVGANVALAFGPWLVRLADVGPVSAAFWRLVLAAPVLVAVATMASGSPFRAARGLWPIVLLAGIAFAGDLASWHIGILRTTLANATLFGNSASLIYPIYGFLVMRAWPNRTQFTALILAGIGAALLLGRSAELSPRNLAGDLFCLLAGTLYAVYFIAMARARLRLGSVQALAVSSVVSVAPLLLTALVLGETVVPTNWTPVVTLAITSQLIGQGLMIYALGELPPLVIGIALLFQPLVSGTIGWIAYDERLTLPDFIGGALVAVALVLVRRGPRKPTQLAQPGASPKSD
ncbi:DMT family transporter [Stakelama marina]|uniref:DMT family transporter n=1 Tax=Stakelama marina TaxID=2826939 RepID=A0A8T4IF36_9SPHN|nr:DMT family transporter [Stakelama marina]MBR0553173.1 DMT family transporter [Stakelama marina]